MKDNKYVIVNGELYHYGVPGMKWGHRKVYYDEYNDNKLKKSTDRTTKKLAKLLRKKEEAKIRYEINKDHIPTSYLGDGNFIATRDYINNKRKEKYEKAINKAQKKIDKLADKCRKQNIDYISAYSESNIQTGKTYVEVTLSRENGGWHSLVESGKFKTGYKNNKINTNYFYENGKVVKNDKYNFVKKKK